MPTYDLKCDKCAQQSEVWVSIHENLPQTHEGCGGNLTQVFSPPLFNAHQGEANVVHDQHGNTTTEHWDGRQDVTVRPKTTDIHVIPQNPG